MDIIKSNLKFLIHIKVIEFEQLNNYHYNPERKPFWGKIKPEYWNDYIYYYSREEIIDKGLIINDSNEVFRKPRVLLIFPDNKDSLKFIFNSLEQAKVFGEQVEKFSTKKEDLYFIDLEELRMEIIKDII